MDESGLFWCKSCGIKDKWKEQAVKLFKAIKFNAENKSHEREVIGGHELSLIEILLTEA